MVSTTLDPSSSAALARVGTSERALQWAARALTATCWISAELFGLYILAFYAAALVDGNIANRAAEQIEQYVTRSFTSRIASIRRSASSRGVRRI